VFLDWQDWVEEEGSIACDMYAHARKTYINMLVEFEMFVVDSAPWEVH
jgi:hypothetical protein